MKIRISRLYSYVAVTLLNAGLLFAGVNVLAWAYMTARPQDPITTTYGERSLEDVYPGRSRDDVRQLLLETWGRVPEFSPFVVSKERRHHGRFVNVHRAGFRISRGQGPWPPDPERLNVFVFGGSTTFGYGVADDESFASALQEWLAPRVAPRAVACYNFGRGSYFSTQEQILFERLLVKGGVPDLAIFVDGLNDLVFALPWLTQPLSEYLSAPVPTSLRSIVKHLPLTRVVSSLKARRDRGPARNPSRYDDRARLNRRLDRYMANRRLITAVASAAGVRVLFVWQPIPLYRYDPSQQPFAAFDSGKNNYARFGYPLLAERVRESPPVPEFLWAADIQETLREPLYVDQVHYTAAMTARFAEFVGTALEERGILTDSLVGD
jgi:lysophospholipase L1-like esterase